jgi:hypothetical protein
MQQPFPLVVPDRFDADTGLLGDLTYLHCLHVRQPPTPDEL